MDKVSHCQVPTRLSSKWLYINESPDFLKHQCAAGLDTMSSAIKGSMMRKALVSEREKPKKSLIHARKRAMTRCQSCSRVSSIASSRDRMSGKPYFQLAGSARQDFT